LPVFGDGAANIGAFHESLNFAAIRSLPVVFVCENNLYGEYSRINLTTPVEEISVRAADTACPASSWMGRTWTRSRGRDDGGRARPAPARGRRSSR